MAPSLNYKASTPLPSFATSKRSVKKSPGAMAGAVL
jgi:hypothetical protein